MRTLIPLAAAIVVISLVTPGLAAGMRLMRGGEVMAVMPDGHIGKATATDLSFDTMQVAKPLDHCMLILTSADGKIFIANTSSAEGKAECEKISK